MASEGQVEKEMSAWRKKIIYSIVYYVTYVLCRIILPSYSWTRDWMYIVCHRSLWFKLLCSYNKEWDDALNRLMDSYYFVIENKYFKTLEINNIRVYIDYYPHFQFCGSLHDGDFFMPSRRTIARATRKLERDLRVKSITDILDFAGCI